MFFISAGLIVAFVVFIPTLVTFLWMTAFGNSIELHVEQGPVPVRLGRQIGTGRTATG